VRLTTFDVENFRGIGSLRLQLDATTVLLGENRVGKTTLVDALEYCLGPRPAVESPFVPADLRRDDDPLAPKPTIHLTLSWTEREPGEWDDAPYAFLAPLLVALEDRSGRRRVSLRLSGRPQAEAVVAEWAFLDAQGNPLPQLSDLERVEALRDLNPCLLLAANRYQLAHARASAAEQSPDAPDSARSRDQGRARRRARASPGDGGERGDPRRPTARSGGHAPDAP
jgi:predicted ATP-dependent endonuclease of OLD family